MPGPDVRDAAIDGTVHGTVDGAAEGAVDEAVPFRPMSVSELLDGVIAGIRRRPRTILGLSAAFAAVIQVAGSVIAYFFMGDDASGEVTPDVLLDSFGAQATLTGLLLALSGYGILLLAGLLAPLLGRELVGAPIAPRGVLRDARPVLWRLVGTAAAVLLSSLLAAALPIVPFVLLVAGGAHPAFGVLAALLGFPLGLALMVWLYVLFVQAVPVVVLERRTVGGALKRARGLIKGRWWRSFGTLLLALLVTAFMGLFALRIPFLFVQLVFFGDSDSSLAGLAVDTVGRIVAWSVVLPFDAGVIAMLYMDQRMRREGFDLAVRLRRISPGRSAQGVPDGAKGSDAEGAEDPFIGLWHPTNGTGATL